MGENLAYFWRLRHFLTQDFWYIGCEEGTGQGRHHLLSQAKFGLYPESRRKLAKHLVFF